MITISNSNNTIGICEPNFEIITAFV